MGVPRMDNLSTHTARVWIALRDISYPHWKASMSADVRRLIELWIFPRPNQSDNQLKNPVFKLPALLVRYPFDSPHAHHWA